MGTLRFVDDNSTAEKYLEEFEACYRSTFFSESAVFQDDGASVHTTRIVKSWRQKNAITTLPWPPFSPDMNPIENCWVVIKNRLQRQVLEVELVIHLKTRICLLWQSLHVLYIQRLFNSMSNRIRQVQLLKGHRIKY